MTRKILLVSGAPWPEGWLERTQALVPGLNIETCRDDLESIQRAIVGSVGMINCPRHHFSANLLRQGGNGLRWIHVGGAGCEEFIIPELVESDVVLTNGKIIQGPEVSDHAIALLLCLTRNIHHSLRGTPVASMPRPIELRGKVMVIIGAGGIGELVAEKARAFGMRVLAVTAEYRPMVSFIDEFYLPTELDQALAQADAVVMAAPNTKQSFHMMGPKQFAAMKPSALYVAVSRGRCTDTVALTQALEDGAIAGAALDVTDPEPLPQDHALRSLENVVLTPHIAGPSDHNRQRSFELIVRNLVAFDRGAPLFNVVDKRLGY